MVASTYKVLLENTPDGQSSATILDFPDCQATAATDQEAINQVQNRLAERLATAKIVSIAVLAPEANEVPTSSIINPWIKFSGIYQDDPDFAEIAAAIRAERNPTEDES
jgi:predicted RNase H-like HicB family nuclease